MSDFNVNAAFNKMVNSLETKSNDLQAAMDKMSSGDTISDQDMLRMQFQINSYNAMLEATSSMTKALVDEFKNLAQRSN